jgi:hypothetical protein
MHVCAKCKGDLCCQTTANRYDRYTLNQSQNGKTEINFRHHKKRSRKFCENNFPKKKKNRRKFPQLSQEKTL